MYIIKAATAEQFRREVVAYFEFEMDRIERERLSMKPKTVIAKQVYAERARQAVAYRDFFSEVTIDNNDRTLGRWNYTNEATRSDAANDARHECERRKKNGENVQWRHLEDERGTAYVVERLGAQ
jgi:hypothetical protein